MDLTTVARVRQYATADGGEMGAGADDLLAMLIAQWSRSAIKVLGWDPELKGRTEFFDVGRGSVYRVATQPVYREVTDLPLGSTLSEFVALSVRTDGSREFGDDTELAIDEDFVLYPETGEIVFDGANLAVGPRTLRIAYTGGVAEGIGGADAFAVAYPDVAGAIEAQVLYAWRNRKNLGGAQPVSGGPATSVVVKVVNRGGMSWVEGAVDALDRNARVLLG